MKLLNNLKLTGVIEKYGRKIALVGLISFSILTPVVPASAAVSTVACSEGGSFQIDGTKVVSNSGNTCAGEAVVPAGVTVIDSFAFSNSGTKVGAVNLRSVQFPSSLLSIGVSAFLNSGLVSLNVPANVTRIFPQAFQGSVNLRNVIIAGNASGTALGYYIFNLDSLDSLVLGTGSGNFTFNQTLVGLHGLSSLTLGSSLTQIPQNFLSLPEAITASAVLHNNSSLNLAGTGIDDFGHSYPIGQTRTLPAGSSLFGVLCDISYQPSIAIINSSTGAFRKISSPIAEVNNDFKYCAPGGAAADTVQKKIYWANSGSTSALFKFDLQGSTSARIGEMTLPANDFQGHALNPNHIFSVTGIAFNSSTQKLYALGYDDNYLLLVATVDPTSAQLSNVIPLDTSAGIGSFIDSETNGLTFSYNPRDSNFIVASTRKNAGDSKFHLWSFDPTTGLGTDLGGYTNSSFTSSNRHFTSLAIDSNGVLWGDDSGVQSQTIDGWQNVGNLQLSAGVNSSYSVSSLTVASMPAPSMTLSRTTERVSPGTSLSGYVISSTGGAIDSYSISPAVDNGLVFDTATGTVSGTPTSVAAMKVYTITAHGVTGLENTATYALTVAMQATVSTGTIANSMVAAFTPGVTLAAIPATSSLPAIALNFGGSVPDSVTVVPVASNPAPASATPFTISSTTKIVDIQISGIFSGSATVCLDGAPSDHLFHFTGGAWVELSSLTYVGGQVCGVTTSFSPFAAAPPIQAPSLITPPIVVVSVPDPIQQSKIAGASISSAPAGTTTPILINGLFVEQIKSIQINGVSLASGSWTQTAKSVAFVIPGKSAGTYEIQIFNGSAPLLKVQSFTFVPSSNETSALQKTPAKARVVYIRCTAVGHRTRIIRGANPVCPSGYVKK